MYNSLLDLRNSWILNYKKGKGGGYYLIKEPRDENLAGDSRYFGDASGWQAGVTHIDDEDCDEFEDEIACVMRHAF